jgi:hypothetical protein
MAVSVFVPLVALLGVGLVVVVVTLVVLYVRSRGDD